MNPSPRAGLARLEAACRARPDAAEPRLRRAGYLAAHGDTEAAKQDYLAVLTREPGNLAALNDFATLLYSTGYRSAARTLYAEAAARHPGNPKPHVNLANLLLEEGDFAAARQAYETALAAAPDLAAAHQGLAQALAELGEETRAAHHRALGFRDRWLQPLPCRGGAAALPLLLLVSARGGNAPVRRLIDETRFRATAVAAEFCAPDANLPPHRLILNAIGDADRDASALDAAEALLARTAAPVLNPPARVRATARLANARRMAAIPGVRTPLIAALPRAALAGPGGAALLAREGLQFPLLLRAPGYHAGRYFLRVEDQAALPQAAASLPGEELAAIEFLDAAWRDGLARKYRAMIVAGAIYPLHLAIAPQWKVHYFSAAMAEHPAYRAEERAFLDDMPAALGPRATAALGVIAERLGLDYAGVDFALGRGGELIFFEANATMVANPPEPGALWAYRAAAAERILAAGRAMLAARALPSKR